MISNYSTVLQVYRNSSATMENGQVAGGEVGTVKIFSNFCASYVSAYLYHRNVAKQGEMLRADTQSSYGIGVKQLALRLSDKHSRLLSAISTYLPAVVCS
jgi:hypothetical protein